VSADSAELVMTVAIRTTAIMVCMFFMGDFCYVVKVIISYSIGID